MKKAALIVSFLAILAVVAFVFLQNQNGPIARAGQNAGQPTRAATQPAGALPPVKAGDEVIAKGRLVPIRYVNLSFNTAGLVNSVPVVEGQVVGAGELLAKLSNQEQLIAAVTTAELELLNAQQALEDLYTRAPLDAAQALLDVINAPQEVQDKERQVNNLTRGTVAQTDVDIARANLVFAERQLKDAEDAYRPWANKDEGNLTRAALLTRLSQAQKQYDDAKANLNALLGNPTEAKVSMAEAELALAKVKQAEAEKKYEVLKNGPDPNEVEKAQAQIKNAEAQLAAARAAVSNLEIHAPFTGTVASVSVSPGEYVAPGATGMMLVDFSDWRVETTDLTELNVVRVSEGTSATVTCDAFPDQPFPGRVEKIKAIGENSQGDIIYTAIVQLTQFNARLRWNMTCSIVFNTD